MIGLPPKASVLLSTYNGERYIAACIDSVIAQSEQQWELIIIDDHSSDSSRDIVAGYSDPRIRVIEIPERRGLYPNLNHMAQLAKAPLLKLWAQDDVMRPDCLRHAIEFRETHPQVKVFYCNSIELHDETGLQRTSEDSTPDVLDPQTADWYLTCHGSLCGNVSTLFADSSAFNAMGGFDNHISADFALLVAAAGAGPIGRMAHYDVLVRHHKNQWSRESSSALKTLVSNAPIYDELMRRAAKRSDPLAHAKSQRVLSEILGRLATPELAFGVLNGHLRASWSAWRAISRHVSPMQMVWHFGRRLMKLPRELP